MKHKLKPNIIFAVISLFLLLIFYYIYYIYYQYNMEYFENNFNLDEYIYNDFLIWTMTSDGYTDITHNLYKSLEKANIPWKLLNICVDDESYNYFKDNNLPCIKYNSNISTKKGEISDIGSNEFMEFNRIKLDLLDYFSKKSLDKIKYVVYMDGDIVVFKDFIPYLQNLYNKDPSIYFYFQCDSAMKELSTSCGHNLCTGFICYKKENLFKSPFKVYDEEKWKNIKQDQPWVNEHIKEYNIPALSLDQGLFPNGTYIEGNVSGIKNVLNEDRFILHYNWLIGVTKIKKMKENNNWYM